jgi:hypothetical protein
VRPFSSNGALDMDGFVKALFAPSIATQEKDKLTQRGFIAAAHRGWLGTDGTDGDIYLIRFSSAAGAQSMNDAMVHTWQDEQAGSPVSDPADQANGVIKTKPDEFAMADVGLVTTRGDTVVYIRYGHLTAPDQVGAQNLLHRQLDALHGSGTAPGA